MTEDPFVVRKCVLLVLRPDIFLPDSRPVPINTDRALRAPQKVITQSKESSWVSYRSCPSRVHLMDARGRTLSEFQFKSLRNPRDLPSVFSLLVNANSKLQSVKQPSCLPDLAHYILIVENTIREIFYVPEQVPNRDPSLVPSVPSSSSGQYQDVANTGTLAQPRKGGDGYQTQDSMDLDRRDDGTVEEDHSNLNITFEDPGCDHVGYDDDEEDEDEDEDEDMINGLTFSEMRTVQRRVSDGTISSEERAEAAMLMLGMAGGELFSLHATLPPSF